MKKFFDKKRYRLYEQIDENPSVELLDYSDFDNDWIRLQMHLKRKGNPEYGLKGSVHLNMTKAKTLKNMIYIIGDLNIVNCDIPTLGDLYLAYGNVNASRSKLRDLGDLAIVIGDLILTSTLVSSLGSLKHINGNLYIRGTDLARNMSPDEIRKKIYVKGDILT